MQVVAFISGKGGVGKSTLAANVATALSQHEKKVLLIDLDPQNAQRLHLGMDPDEIAGLIREGISPTSVFDSPFGVKFIPFGRANESELADFETALKHNPKWVLNGIDSLSSHAFDFIILDTPPGATVYLQQALEASQLALVIVLADAASYATIPKTMSLVEQYTQERPDFVGVKLLLNQMPIQSKLGHQVRSALQIDYAQHLVPVCVHKDAHVSHALASDSPVLEFAPTCQSSMDIRGVAGWLIDSVTA